MSIGVITGALVLTSGVLEGRYELHMRVRQAEGISQDTRVLLQGLQIGRVKDVTPHLDSVAGALSFVAALSIRERFPDGTRLAIPRGTRARIVQSGLVGNIAIDLQMPSGATLQGFLEPGDTIQSERVASVTETLGAIAQDLSDDVVTALDETRALMVTTRGTVADAQRTLAQATPAVMRVLERLAETLDRADHMLAAIEPKVGPVADSVLVTLGSTRTLIADLQVLADTASAIAIENKIVLAEIMVSLERTAGVLAHFADQVSRRPLRLFTGVTPPDSTRKP